MPIWAITFMTRLCRTRLNENDKLSGQIPSNFKPGLIVLHLLRAGGSP